MITRQATKKPGKYQTPATASPSPPLLRIPPFHCRHVCCATLVPPPCCCRNDPRGDMWVRFLLGMLVWVGGRKEFGIVNVRGSFTMRSGGCATLRTSIWGNSLSPLCLNVRPLAPGGDPFPKSQLPQSLGDLSNNEEDPSTGNWQRVRLPPFRANDLQGCTVLRCFLHHTPFSNYPQGQSYSHTFSSIFPPSIDVLLPRDQPITVDDSPLAVSHPILSPETYLPNQSISLPAAQTNTTLLNLFTQLLFSFAGFHLAPSSLENNSPQFNRQTYTL